MIDGKFKLDNDALSSVLMSEKCKDKKVAVISVAGAFRKGKSFLLNFVLRYLHRQGWTKTGWLTDDGWLLSGSKTETLEGFEWMSRTATVTIGMHMWSEPFLVPLESEEVCVLVMDTQGLHDSEHSLKNTALIFALSTLTSSVQIFNVKEQIQEDDLQTLDMFSAYGKLMAQQTPNFTPFQKLLFLIRDWPYAGEFSYGFRGGQLYLDKRLAIGKNTPEEGSRARNNIRSYYEEVSCFLMPHPGNQVTKKTFKGQLNDIDHDFAIQMQSFVHRLVSPKILSPKRIAQSTISGRQLMEYFKTYFDLFQDGSMPEPQTMLDATSEATNRFALSLGKDFYLEKMNIIVNMTLPDEGLQMAHKNISCEAFKIFDRVPKIGDPKKTEEYRNILNDFIDTNWNYFRDMNLENYNNLAQIENTKALTDALASYVTGMNDVLKRRNTGKPFLEMVELQDFHRKCRQNAMDIFNREKCKGGAEMRESYRSQLEKEIEVKWTAIKDDNQMMQEHAKVKTEEAKKKLAEELAKQKEESDRII